MCLHVRATRYIEHQSGCDVLSLTVVGRLTVRVKDEGETESCNILKVDTEKCPGVPVLQHMENQERVLCCRAAKS